MSKFLASRNVSGIQTKTDLGRKKTPTDSDPTSRHVKLFPLSFPINGNYIFSFTCGSGKTNLSEGAAGKDRADRVPLGSRLMGHIPVHCDTCSLWAGTLPLNSILTLDQHASLSHLLLSTLATLFFLFFSVQQENLFIFTNRNRSEVKRFFFFLQSQSRGVFS